MELEAVDRDISNQVMKILYIDIDINMTLEMKYCGVCVLILLNLQKRLLWKIFTESKEPRFIFLHHHNLVVSDKKAHS